MLAGKQGTFCLSQFNLGANQAVHEGLVLLPQPHYLHVTIIQPSYVAAAALPMLQLAFSLHSCDCCNRFAMLALAGPSVSGDKWSNGDT